jgi:hypothetical protein
LKNSSNIRIFGAKTETYQPYISINNCKNIFLTNIIDLANLNSGLTKQNLIEIVDLASDSIEIANSMFLSPPNSTYLITKDPWHTNTPNRTMHLGLYYKNFTTFFKSNSSTVSNLNTINSDNWTLFPNPTSSIFTIKSNMSDNTEYFGHIYNVFGEIIKSVEIKSSETKIDLTNQARGIYILDIHNVRGHHDLFKILRD